MSDGISISRKRKAPSSDEDEGDASACEGSAVGSATAAAIDRMREEMRATADQCSVMKALLEQSCAHVSRMHNEMKAMRIEMQVMKQRLPPPLSGTTGASGNGKSPAPEPAPRAPPGVTLAMTSAVTKEEGEIISIVEGRKRGGKWPLKHKRAERFRTDPELNRLRLFSGPFVRHHMLSLEKSENGKGCVLCMSAQMQKNTRNYCSLCSVPLCRVRRDGFETTCFEAWHSAADLGAERKRRIEANERDLVEKQAMRLIDRTGEV